MTPLSVPGAGVGHHGDAPTDETIVAVQREDGNNADDEAAISIATAPGAARYRGWKAMPFVLGNETFEKLGSIGAAANLMVYLTSVFHVSGVRSAVALNAFAGTTNLATVLGAVASDLYLGRYATVGIGSVATLIGMIILTLTAGVPALHPPPCAVNARCAGATRGQIAVLVLAFAFIVVGAGGIRPCSLPFGADQFDPCTTSGRRGIASFFNWYYFTLTLAVLLSSTLIVYVQTRVSWCFGFAVPAALMLAACALFFSGTGLYVRARPDKGSCRAFSSLLRVAAAAFHKRRLPAPADPAAVLFRARHVVGSSSSHVYTDQFRFLEKAAVVVSAKAEVDAVTGEPKDTCRLCTVQKVEEAKCVLRVLPVWATCVVYYLAFAQTTTYVVLQAAQSDRRLAKRGSFEIPPASFTVFPMVALAVWVPIYDRLFLPWLRRLTGREDGITLLQRMGTGMALSVLAMLLAAAAEHRRRALAVMHAAAVSPASAFWLVPQLAALGLSEALNQVGQVEFYYGQFPESMRSVAGSLLFTGIALASYLSGAMVGVVQRVTAEPAHGVDGWLAEDLNRGRLDFFYLLIGFIGAINFVVFLVCAKWYRYKQQAAPDNPVQVDGDGSHGHDHHMITI